MMLFLLISVHRGERLNEETADTHLFCWLDGISVAVKGSKQ